MLLVTAVACADEPPPPTPWAGSGGVEDDGPSDDADDDSDDDDDNDDNGAGSEGSEGGDEESGGEESGGETGDDGPVDPGTPAGTCGPEGPTSGVVQVTLDSPERWYYLGAPPSDDPLPLVLAFHGDEGHPDEAVTWFWEPVWEVHQDFIIAMMKCPGCTSWYQGDTTVNVQYVWDVLEDISSTHNVDVSRIYAIGYSGGSSFLAMHGLEFQSVFAGIQWHCGGGWTSYVPPPAPACKVDGRFVISTDDFLWDNAKAMEALLLENDHEVEFIEAACSGHCCHTDDLAEGAWAWFKQRTKCDDIVTGECAAVDDIP